MSTQYVKTLGIKDFHGEVDITDPCYDRDVWCRMNNVKIAKGQYTCVVYVSKHWYDDPCWKGLTPPVGRKKRIYYNNIDSIGIFHTELVGDNIENTRLSMDYIGNIGVDAGLAGFFHNKPDYNDKEWHDFCDSIHRSRDAYIRDNGFFAASDDGGYDVYAAYDPNTQEIIGLEIDFLNHVDDEN